jgi:hypothetical protein
VNQPTYDDVNLILKLYDMRREEKLRSARTWFSSTFKVKSLAAWDALCPPNSENNAYVRQVTTYWDMVASFITGGVLNQDLFFESGRELLFVWLRIELIIGEFRAAIQDPHYLKNLETVGKAFAEHLKKQDQTAYENFVGRVRRS